MAGLRIPGPLGGDFSLGIDDGTLSRVLSFPPSPLDGVEDWARQQLRRAARQGIRVVALIRT
jgi:hypothetical protein